MINSSLSFLFYSIIFFSCYEKYVEVYDKKYIMGTTYSIKCSDCRYTTKKIKNIIQFNVNKVNNVASTYLKKSSISLINKFNKNYFVIASHFLHYNFYVCNHYFNNSNFKININYLITIWGSNNYYKNPVCFVKLLNSVKNNNVHIFFINKILVKINSISSFFCCSASAKGYAVDQTYKIIKFFGIIHCVFEIGGEIKSGGLSYFRKVWRIGFLEPFKKNVHSQYLKIYNIYNCSLASSGLYLNNDCINKETFNHASNTKKQE